MTIPVPRDDTLAGGSVPTTTVLSLINDGLREVKEAVGQLSRDVHDTFARMPNEYVPRREVERRLDEFSLDLGAERAERIAAIQALKDSAADADKARGAARRWLIGLAAGSAFSAAGVALGVIDHFH